MPPKQKQKWLPAKDVDPNIFKVPPKASQRILIQRPVVLPTASGGHVNSETAHQEPTPAGSTTNTARHEPQQLQKSLADLTTIASPLKPTPSEAASTHRSTSISGLSSANDKQCSALLVHPLHQTINGIQSEAARSDVASTHETLRSPNTLRHLPSRSNLDIYARKHIPYWLRAINESYANTIHTPQIPRLDLDAYRASFAGTDFQRQLPPLELPALQFSETVANLGVDLDHRIYTLYWQEALRNEFTSQAVQNDTFALFAIELTLIDAIKHLYRFKVPGLRESTPRIDLGDIVLIRPFVQSTAHIAMSVKEAQKWSQHRDGLAPGFLGDEHHAVVWSVIRRDETVLVRLGKALIRDVRCNIIIPLQIQKNIPTWRAVSQVGSSLAASRSLWLHRMLFPTDGVLQESLSRGTFDVSWHDPNLNFEQQRAIQAIVDAKYGDVPYLISGPPGTGKTKTLVETALQLIKASGKVKPHLLICAPSDAAADTLLVRLSEILSPAQLFRLNNWTRLPNEVPGEVRPFCYLDETQLYSLPPFETLMSFKVVVTTCRDANVLVTAGLTNGDLQCIALRLLRAIAPSAVEGISLLHWTALLLDEAAQATEPEALVPLSVVQPLGDLGDDMLQSCVPQVVMAGDEYQLGPGLASTAIAAMSATLKEEDTSRKSGLEKSLFQRLFERPLYADHVLSRSHGLPPLTRDMLPIIRPPFANLIRNYRSHPAILSTSSALFYSDTLIPERPDASEAILSWHSWPRQSKTTWPVMFHQNTGADGVESILEGDGTGAGTIMNQIEAQIVLDLVLSLIKHVSQAPTTNASGRSDYLYGEDIIILSPFRAQVNYLRRLFRDRGYHDIRIGPLEAFQGLEARVVVICTTRTRLGQHPHPPAKFINEDKARNLGIVDMPKPFNVATTRAKEALIVVGNAEALTVTGDPCWTSFLRFCIRNELCTGGKVGWFAKNTGRDGMNQGMGKLERALRYAESLKEADKPQHHGGTSLSQSSNVAEVEGTFRFRLRGTMIDLDERMWEMQLGEDEADLLRQEEEENDEDSDVDGAEGQEGEAEEDTANK